MSTQIMGGYVLRNLTSPSEEPYDGKTTVKSDRKSGWAVRHALLDKWIEAIPNRVAADEIAEAFDIIADKSYLAGQKNGRIAGKPKHVASE